MKALVYKGDRQLELVLNYKQPKPKKGYVLLKISRAAICGTDIHKFRNSSKNVEKIDGILAIAGHEPSGWVCELGDGVTELKIGQRALVAGVFGCNSCRQCKAGFNTGCENELSGLHWNNHGCNTEYIAVPATNVIPIPDSVSFDVASILTCAGGTAMTIIEETQLQERQHLAIVGLGPVGQSLLILAKSIGVKVAGIEISAARRNQAEKLGIERVVDPIKEDPIAAIRKWTNGRGCEVVAECVGKTSTQFQAIEMAANRGKIAIAGLGNEDVSSKIFQRIIGNGGLSLIGIAATPIRYMQNLISLTAEKKLPFSELITHRFSLEQASEALALMEKGDCGKIIFEISDSFEK